MRKKNHIVVVGGKSQGMQDAVIVMSVFRGRFASAAPRPRGRRKPDFKLESGIKVMTLFAKEIGDLLEIKCNDYLL